MKPLLVRTIEARDFPKKCAMGGEKISQAFDYSAEITVIQGVKLRTEIS
ncbi:hypothetical protein DFR49_0537 [Hephaestia caeni]|jgi:hypothetical protein|uniref:Uncharacterized protein n=2 Tax=Sphingomonadaceae TaxID=41297 RepID=A0A397PAM1_9SPHN|nr:hypothetical protein HMPREF9718_03833 [Sphingobium yanoikuyae ATCC 51230]RIA46008.1 hypothetical protein DFR49_0537 [Hephaestia caeni]